jgi:putative Holliday junction resolvase
MRWLALDVGSRRVGVALCDERESVVTALTAFRYSGPQRAALVVSDLTRKWVVGGVVVGVPQTRGGEGRGELRVRAVVTALRAGLGVEVETADERGTTQEAEQLLAEAGVPRGRWKDLVDSMAARVILEGFLASRHQGDGPQGI